MSQQATPTSADPSGPRLRLDASTQLLRRARDVIPGETSSLMKRPQMFCEGSFPAYLESGSGATVRDVDGNQYVDYVCGLGANTLGHNHPAVLEALRGALADGLSHSLPTPLEVEASEALLELIPGAQMARFFKTGADATSAAVRLSRHQTGRERIAIVGYNGWHDHFMFDTPGVPAALARYTQRMPLFAPDDEPRLLELIEREGDQLALLLLSLPYNRCVGRDFLHTLRAACRERGVLFVLDEVVTGFRLALGGAQEYYGLEADLVCLSKGIAAGMPLSAVVGPRRTMTAMGEIQVSTTFGGERLSLAACLAALAVYRDSDAIATMAALGTRLREGINRVSEQAGTALFVAGYPAIPCFQFARAPEAQAALMQTFVGEMARRGVLLRRDVNFMCAAHTARQVDDTVDAASEVLRQMAETGQDGR